MLAITYLTQGWMNNFIEESYSISCTYWLLFYMVIIVHYGDGYEKSYIMVMVVIIGYTWLLLVMHGYSWLSMVIAGYPWLLLVMHGYLWLFMVIYGYSWLLLVMHGYSWLFIY